MKENERAARSHLVALEDERHGAGLERRFVAERELERDGGVRGGHRLERFGARSDGVLAQLVVVVVVVVQRLLQADGPDHVGGRRFCAKQLSECMVSS